MGLTSRGVSCASPSSIMARSTGSAATNGPLAPGQANHLHAGGTAVAGTQRSSFADAVVGSGRFARRLVIVCRPAVKLRVG